MEDAYLGLCWSRESSMRRCRHNTLPVLYVGMYDNIYLLRTTLKVTLKLGHNSSQIPPELIPISSRAKLNNFVERNKLNSDF